MDSLIKRKNYIQQLEKLKDKHIIKVIANELKQSIFQQFICLDCFVFARNDNYQ